jgi:hypothetical protein
LEEKLFNDSDDETVKSLEKEMAALEKQIKKQLKDVGEVN